MPKVARKLVCRGMGLLLIFALSGLLAACTGPAASASKRPLQVEYTNWEGDYTLLIAQEKGLFEKHGVQVEPVYYADFNQALPDIAAGKLDAGLFGLFDTFNVASLIDAKVVAVYDSGGVTSVMAAPGIQSLQDLKGKRIGVTFGSSGEMVIRDALYRGGLTQRDVTLVNLPVAEIPAHLPKDIQAGVTYEPYSSQALQAGNKALASSEASSLLPDVIFFRSEVVRQRPEDVRAFLAAWFEAVEYRLANPAESRQIISKATGLAEKDLISGDAKLMTLRDNLRYFSEDSASDQMSIYAIAQVNMKFLVDSGNMTSLMEIRGLFDPSYLPSEIGAVLTTAMLGR